MISNVLFEFIQKKHNETKNIAQRFPLHLENVKMFHEKQIKRFLRANTMVQLNNKKRSCSLLGELITAAVVRLIDNLRLPLN